MINKVIHFTSVSALTCVVGLFCTAFAGYAVSSNVDSSAIYSGAPSKHIPKFISQKVALETQEKTGALIRIAYNISLGQDLTLAQLSPSEYYYYNTYTNTLAVAKNSKDAVSLSQIKPTVFYAVTGERLSETIRRWAENNGMHLNYMLDEDYLLQYPYTFYGKLTEPKGPLNNLLESFSSGPNAMKAVVMKNNVINITRNSYVPAPVVGV